MRIGFDVSQTGKSKAGCGYFADALIRQLAASDTQNEYILYPALGDIFWDPECASATFTSGRTNFRRLAAPRDFEASRQFWQNPGPDFEKQLGNPDIVHANNFYCPKGLKRARLVYTVHDLSFLVEPAWTTEANRVGCVQGLFQASLRADAIVAVSEFTRRHFLSVFGHFPAERATVISPASRFQATAPGASPGRFSKLKRGGFWLSVGTIEPRKNQQHLLEAYRILKNEHGSILPLVLAGGRGWLMNDFQAHVEALELQRDVILTGYVSDAELQCLFENCFGFIYPSSFEGFGMPVLEALGLGAPVLCSNTTSLPEVAGEAALYFDPADAASIAAAMERLTRGEVNREILISAGYEQAKRFSWAASAARVSELYEQVMAQPRLWPVETAQASVT